MATTAVVILNYNGAKFLRQFLPGVIQHSQQAQIVVADNASTDDSCEIIQTEFPQVTLIRLDANYGFCGGYNRALQQVDADYYVLLNSDVEVTPNWIEPCIALFNQDKSIAAIQPKIKSWHQRDHFEYAGAAGGFVDWLGYPFCRGRLFDHVEKDYGQYNDVREIFWATGACMFIRSSVYHKLGGLDEDFFAHMEEIDLCWRIHRSGKKVMYQGNSTVYHVGGGTLPKNNPRKTFYNFRNGLWLLIKNMPSIDLMFKLPIRLILDYMAILKFMLDGNRQDAVAVIRAHYHFVKKFRAVIRKRKLSDLPFRAKKLSSHTIIIQRFLLGKQKIDI